VAAKGRKSGAESKLRGRGEEGVEGGGRRGRMEVEVRGIGVEGVGGCKSRWRGGSGGTGFEVRDG